jgi:hypothetical protein
MVSLTGGNPVNSDVRQLPMIIPAQEIYSLLIRRGVPFAGGVIVTGVLGLVVDKSVRVTRERWDDHPPTGISEEDWKTIFKMSPRALQPIRWLGWLERFSFFVALWLNSPVLVAGWLAFKVASKWETWQNIIKVPESFGDVFSSQEMFAWRLRYGSNILQRFLLGTLGNVVCALIGLIAAKFIVLMLS